MDNCFHCDEPILPGEVFEPINYVDETGASVRHHHIECGLRAVMGSAAHQLKRCTCYGYKFEDPEYMTKREAAKMSFFIFYISQNGYQDPPYMTNDEVAKMVFFLSELLHSQPELAISANTEA